MSKKSQKFKAALLSYDKLPPRDSMLKTGRSSAQDLSPRELTAASVRTKATSKQTAGQIHDDIREQRLQNRFECIATGKYLTEKKHGGIAERLRASMAHTFFGDNHNVLVEIFRFVNLTEVFLKMT